MEAVAVLHQRGSGRLKLFCYVKEGLGAWRHCLIASDTFPNRIHDLSESSGLCSLPGSPIAAGDTPQDIADHILLRYPKLVDAALGSDPAYVDWFAQLLAAHPEGVLEMESPRLASMGRVDIHPPAFGAHEQ